MAKTETKPYNPARINLENQLRKVAAADIIKTATLAAKKIELGLTPLPQKYEDIITKQLKEIEDKKKGTFKPYSKIQDNAKASLETANSARAKRLAKRKKIQDERKKRQRDPSALQSKSVTQILADNRAAEKEAIEMRAKNKEEKDKALVLKKKKEADLKKKKAALAKKNSKK